MNRAGSVIKDLSVVLILLSLVAFGTVIFSQVVGVGHGDAVAEFAVGVGEFPSGIQLFVHSLHYLHGL